MAVNWQLQVSVSGFTRYGASNPAVDKALIPVPPLHEQEAIATFLDRQTEAIDSLSARVETAIKRLQEYWTGGWGLRASCSLRTQDSIRLQEY